MTIRMNKLDKILSEINDDDLKTAVIELKSKRETGILCDGFVRELAHKIVKEVGISFHDALKIAEENTMVMAAFKWAEQ